MAIDYKDVKQVIDMYFDRINNPTEEGDFLEALNFHINHAMFDAAAEFAGWAGVVDYGTEVDVGKIEENLDVELLAPIGKLIPVLCERFGAPDPFGGDVDGFIEWYKEACGRNGTDKIFPDFVFKKYFASK